MVHMYMREFPKVRGTFLGISIVGFLAFLGLFCLDPLFLDTIIYIYLCIYICIYIYMCI